MSLGKPSNLEKQFQKDLETERKAKIAFEEKRKKDTRMFAADDEMRVYSAAEKKAAETGRRLEDFNTRNKGAMLKKTGLPAELQKMVGTYVEGGRTRRKSRRTSKKKTRSHRRK